MILSEYLSLLADSRLPEGRNRVFSPAPVPSTEGSFKNYYFLNISTPLLGEEEVGLHREDNI